jgi:hypothetical protein
MCRLSLQPNHSINRKELRMLRARLVAAFGKPLHERHIAQRLLTHCTLAPTPHPLLLGGLCPRCTHTTTPMLAAAEHGCASWQAVAVRHTCLCRISSSNISRCMAAALVRRHVAGRWLCTWPCMLLCRWLCTWAYSWPCTRLCRVMTLLDTSAPLFFHTLSTFTLDL